MDWEDTGYSYFIEVSMVSQTNVNSTLGILRGVKLDGMTITENYNSDSRIQAKISTVVDDDETDGYIANSRLRITLVIPDRGYNDDLVTGYVTNISEKTEHGYTQRDYTIEGTIWGLLEHKMHCAVTVKKGSTLLQGWTNLMKKQTKMQYSVTGAKNHTYNRNAVYEAGTSLGSILFQMSSGYSRMDTNGKGVVTLKAYTEPKKQTATRTIDFNDPKGLALSPLNKTSSQWEIPGRAVVTANVSTTDKNGKTTQKTMVGYYDAPASHATSLSTRGWLRGRQDAYKGVSENPSKSELNAEAKTNWQNSQNKGIIYSCKTVFANFHEGEVITLMAPVLEASGKPSGIKVLVESVQTDLKSFTQDLKMKEV